MSNPKKTNKTKPVWAHAPSKRKELRERIVAFCAGRDVVALPPCDEALLPADLACNEAALAVLLEARAIPKREARVLARGLVELREEIVEGTFRLDPELEDVHINLEAALREKVGEIAGKLHSGRSRNDQVAADLRMWSRNNAIEHLERMIETVKVLLAMAVEEKETLMPGFSHHQRAFVTTWGHQIASYAESWLRDIERGLGVFDRTNRSPLGAAAGFGTSWPLNRKRLAGLLGFEGLIENSLDAVASRLEVEQDVASWLAIWMGHCSTTAQDLILYSMEEFRWVTLAVETTTGSSIMPQKRNPDFAEVVKGKTATVHGSLMSLLSLGKGQPSGYHRDGQYSKPIGMDIWREVGEVPTVIRAVFETLRVNRTRMRKATEGGFLEAAEWADAISRESGLPFRDIYSAIGIAVDRCRAKGKLDRSAVNAALKASDVSFRADAELAKRVSSPKALIANRKSLGSPNPKRVEEQVARCRKTLASYVSAVREKRTLVATSKAARIRLIRSLANN